MYGFPYTYETRGTGATQLVVDVVIPFRRHNAKGEGFNPRGVAQFTKRANRLSRGQKTNTGDRLSR